MRTFFPQIFHGNPSESIEISSFYEPSHSSSIKSQTSSIIFYFIYKKLAKKAEGNP